MACLPVDVGAESLAWDSSATPMRPLIIFDWDDTLMPTSALGHGGLLQDHLQQGLLGSHREELSACAVAAKRAICAAKCIGEVRIITNAVEGWVQHSTTRFLPTFQDALDGLSVISAQSMYLPTGVVEPARWKQLCFAREAQNMWQNSSSPRHVVSIGDSWYERAAVMRLAQDPLLSCCAKSLKFAEGPSFQRLAQELEICAACLEQVARYSGHLDLAIGDDLVLSPLAAAGFSPWMHCTAGLVAAEQHQLGLQRSHATSPASDDSLREGRPAPDLFAIQADRYFADRHCLQSPETRSTVCKRRRRGARRLCVSSKDGWGYTGFASGALLSPFYTVGKRLTTLALQACLAYMVACRIPMEQLFSPTVFWKGSSIGLGAYFLKSCAPLLARSEIGFNMFRHSGLVYSLACVANAVRAISDSTLAILLWALAVATLFDPLALRHVTMRAKSAFVRPILV